MSGIYAGVDLGGTTVKMGFVNTDGTLMRKWEIPTRKEDNGSHVSSDIAAAIKENLSEEGLCLSELDGVGIGVPGPILENGYAPKIVNVGLVNWNPAKELSSLLDGVYVKGGNDANVAALGEMWQGGARGHKNAAAITLGTGIGCGIVIDGRIVNGSMGMAGEAGHMVIDWDWPKENGHCSCGAYGCLEQFASATGIANIAKIFMRDRDTPSVLRSENDITAKSVFDAAIAGDAFAGKIADYCMMYLARGLAHISVVVDPEIFVIGGGVAKAGDYLIDLVRKHYDPLIVMRSEPAVIALAALGNDAGIYGAAKMAIDEKAALASSGA